MTDIIERLRRTKPASDGIDILTKAANEIERLQAALHNICALASRRGPADQTEALNKIEAAAKAALAE